MWAGTSRKSRLPGTDAAARSGSRYALSGVDDRNMERIVKIPSEFFGRVYVINLPERVDRRKEVAAVLARIGMPLGSAGVELFPAVKPDGAAGFPSPGVRGCFLSHLNILRQAQAANLPSVLILEDDVEFPGGFATLWPGIMAQLDGASWDFAYLGYTHVDDSTMARRSTRSVTMRPYRERVRTTHAYAVQRPVYQRLIAHLEELERGRPGDTERGPMDVDGAYNAFRRRYPETVTLIAEPQVAWQRATHSDLHARNWHALPGVSALLAPVRMLKNLVRRFRS